MVMRRVIGGFIVELGRSGLLTAHFHGKAPAHAQMHDEHFARGEIGQ